MIGFRDQVDGVDSRYNK